MMEHLLALRHALHQQPEISGQEIQTAATIRDFIQQHHPTEIWEKVGGHGLVAHYEFGQGGPTIWIRCELDALPIQEVNPFAHRSQITGVSHKCGHDGHMTMVAGLIFWLKQQAFAQGRVALIFQPAEETGAGGRDMLADPRMQGLEPDAVFALHNMPGQALHQVILLESQFSCTVQSVAIFLEGIETHASAPETGLNPALTLAEILSFCQSLNQPDLSRKDFCLITPVHAHLGKLAYGIAAGKGEVHLTMRTRAEEPMITLCQRLHDYVHERCQSRGLSYDLDWREAFPAAPNDPTLNELLSKVAADHNLDLQRQTLPYRFGEDFGHFAKKYPAIMFGLGAGEQHPDLHQADYDFPDALIPTGMGLFQGLIEALMEGK
ncbi:MAG: amidohydrolase [Bacteroidota bacterium]